MFDTRCHSILFIIKFNIIKYIVFLFSTGVPMLAVITKTDQVSNPSELEDIENTLAGELGMTGAKERIFCTKLYCNEVTPGLKRDEEIDTNMCRIWEYILRPELINNKPKPGRIGSLLKR